MGRELLLASPSFHSSIQESARILHPFGIDLLDCFQAPNGWDDPVASSAGLAAVQVRAVTICIFLAWFHSGIISIDNLYLLVSAPSRLGRLNRLLTPSAHLKSQAKQNIKVDQQTNDMLSIQVELQTVMGCCLTLHYIRLFPAC